MIPGESNKLGVPVPTPPVGLINDAVRRGERAEQGHWNDLPDGPASRSCSFPVPRATALQSL